MIILANSENQGVKTSIFDKKTFYISVGQNSRTMFSKKKQKIVLSLDFSVNIICSDTKKFIILGNSFDLFPRTRGWIHHLLQQFSSIGYINSLPETQLEAIEFFKININNFFFVTYRLSCDFQIRKSIFKSLSNGCFYFITYTFNIDGIKGITLAVVNGWYEASVKYC